MAATTSRGSFRSRSNGAGYLFSELHRLGILESQFYTDDKAFDSRKKMTADPELKKQFEAALNLAEQRANATLVKNSKDSDALFALTLSSGLKADYAALIEKRNMASLSLTKEASTRAQTLLAADPNRYDAYIATGIGKYIIGSMAAPVRWLLRVGGFKRRQKRRHRRAEADCAEGNLPWSFCQNPAGHRLRERQRQAQSA